MTAEQTIDDEEIKGKSPSTRLKPIHAGADTLPVIASATTISDTTQRTKSGNYDQMNSEQKKKNYNNNNESVKREKRVARFLIRVDKPFYRGGERVSGDVILKVAPHRIARPRRIRIKAKGFERTLIKRTVKTKTKKKKKSKNSDSDSNKTKKSKDKISKSKSGKKRTDRHKGSDVFNDSNVREDALSASGSESESDVSSADSDISSGHESDSHDSSGHECASGSLRQNSKRTNSEQTFFCEWMDLHSFATPSTPTEEGGVDQDRRTGEEEEEEEEEEGLPVGQHRFPFSFVLPENLPAVFYEERYTSSLRDSRRNIKSKPYHYYVKAAICYKIKAVLEYEEEGEGEGQVKQLKHIERIIVHEPVDMGNNNDKDNDGKDDEAEADHGNGTTGQISLHSRASQRPSHQQRQTTHIAPRPIRSQCSKKFLFDKGKLSMEISLPQTYLSRNENIIARVAIVNESSKDLSALHMRLIRTIKICSNRVVNGHLIRLQRHQRANRADENNSSEHITKRFVEEVNKITLNEDQLHCDSGTDEGGDDGGYKTYKATISMPLPSNIQSSTSLGRYIQCHYSLQMTAEVTHRLAKPLTSRPIPICIVPYDCVFANYQPSEW